MSGSVFSLPKTLAHSAGVVVPGAQLRFFLSGTSTPTDSYQDITLSTPHAVPVEADSGGIFPVIYLSPYITYRVRLSDSSATQIYQVDNVNVSIDESATYRLKHTAPALIFEETDASANNGKWRIVANGEVWAIQTGDDAESWTSRLVLSRSGVLSGGVVTGSFTGALSGMTSATTGTINYIVTGNFCTLYATLAITGTSNAATMQLSGLPSVCQAVTAQATQIVFGFRNNGVSSLVGVAVALGSTVNLGLIDSSGTFAAGSTSNFTNSGTKGLDGGWTLTYPL